MNRLVFRCFLVLWICFLFQLKLSAQDAESAKILFIRDLSFSPYIKPIQVYINKVKTVQLGYNEQFELEVSPGAYRLEVDANEKDGIDLQAESGKTYHFVVGLDNGFWIISSQIASVDSSYVSLIRTVNRVRPYTSLTPVQANPPKKKSSIGFTIMPTFGLGENIFEIETEDGEKSTFKFGSGVLLGFNYAYEFNDHFETEFEIGYRDSELSPVLENVEVSFNRIVFTATPYLLIPINRTKTSHIKLGVGPNLYFSNEFMFDFRDIGGPSDTYVYNGNLGYAATIGYQALYTSSISMSFYLRYSSMEHTIKSSKSGFYINDKSFTNPDASSIDLAFSFRYKF